MKPIRTALLTTALIASFAGLAMADTDKFDSPRSARMETMHAHKSKRQNEQLSELKSQLHLQNTQEAAWTNFTQAMVHPPRFDRIDRQTLSNMTTPERLAHMQAQSVVRNEHNKKRIDGTLAFYANLNPDQQKIFDQAIGRSMHTGMHTGMHGKAQHKNHDHSDAD